MMKECPFNSCNKCYIWVDYQVACVALQEAEELCSSSADAIIDRIAHDSYRINITSINAEHDISMREVYGLDKTLRE